MISTTIAICFMTFVLIIIGVFFSKKYIDKIENKIFSYLILVNFGGLLLQILNYSVTIVFRDLNLNWYYGLVKIGFSYYIIWEALFILYVYVVSFKTNLTDVIKRKRYCKFRNFIIMLTLISLFILFTLPVKGYQNLSGACIMFLYLIIGFGIIFVIFNIFKNINNIINKKYLPLIFYAFVLPFTILIQITNPNINIIIPVEAIVVILIYFTNENPDLKMIEEINYAKNVAEKANNAKDEFLSSMSHEIRTPLNAIVGFSECIKLSDTIEEAKENADDIIDASKTLVEIVDNVLDISSIESGTMEVKNNNYSTKEVFFYPIKLVNGKLRQKNIDFQVNIDGNIPEVLYGDQLIIKKVISNLLVNAFKYTDEGYIKYSVSSVIDNNNCKLIITIEDSGRGIKRENLKNLFSKFQRDNEDINTTKSGLGLGLAITKELVDLMNGKIIVESNYLEGSKFVVILNQRMRKKSIDFGSLPDEIYEIGSKQSISIVQPIEVKRKKVHINNKEYSR